SLLYCYSEVCSPWKGWPGDKYVAVAGGRVTLQIYALAHPEKPVLEVLSHKRDWVAWTPEGYYAGTPAGEQLMGWKVTTDEDQLATFYPARAFHKKFYRPDVIQRLLAEGSVK